MSIKFFPFVILAGGLGTRLRLLTYNTPKSLIKINKIPFIQHQLLLLKKHGIKKVIICLGFLGSQIEHYLKKRDNFGLEIHFSYDGANLLGTGGALKKAFPLLDENFFVLYGDSYLVCDYEAIQKNFILSKKSALMTVFKNNGLWDKSNIDFDGEKIIDYNKTSPTPRMNYIDYGLGILNKNVFLDPEIDIAYDLADVYKTLLANNQLAAFEVENRFYEIGSLQGIAELERFLMEQKNEVY